MSISRETSLEELAAIVSQTLTRAGIDAVLSGGGAVTQYSGNEYMSTDLDFVTTERRNRLTPVMGDLGFKLHGREYAHPQSRFLVEFPAGPLAFGDMQRGEKYATR